MKLILTYEGDLPSLQNKRGKKGYELLHNIRKQFHPQLKRHWQTNKFLSEWKTTQSDFDRENHRRPSSTPRIAAGDERHDMRKLVPEAHRMAGFRFTPLTRKHWYLNCTLDILFLRRDPPGPVTKHGDIDNRIKTLVDALRLPDANQVSDNMTPGDGEDPFYVLMEDDELLTRLNVETQMLLTPQTSPDDKSVKLVIRADVTPYHFTMDNLSFG
ncbi:MULTISPECIES: hypothetical protein [unclassified Ruegeria]|uniref:hypothetical protein n=1 Tax=unclassified Ruegeria TaxID=2625375 RepID=UPI0014889629|nr:MULTISPECIES: hypothetical protein [unclassified Ruegeria]